MAEEVAGDGGYFAFISYSHRDSAEARRIHRALETYRLPPRVGGSVRRLFPIFRDREELSAGGDLSAQVQTALAASRALIVLCSPDAAASQWVGKEIETFRALYPDRPILAALIRGEPEAAFHPALTEAGRREPVAADFRKGGDGRRLAQLKLVAGLTGLGLDALVQRDAQRQFRRVTAITLASFVAVLTMAVLLVVALRAQSEAERQRAEAEGLVEYMLTDLRDRLKGVGRLDVMTAVNERAMAYYGKQGDLARLPDESLERRARILHAMGEDDEKRGDLDKALKKFTEAHRATEAVLSKNPDNADAIFAHAQSEYWVGYAAWQKKDRKTTTRYWQGYLTQAEQLAKVENETARSRLELGYAYGNLCDLNLANHFDLLAARAACEASIQHERAALKVDPNSVEVRRALANRHGWLANVLYELRDYQGSLSQRDHEREIVGQLLATDPRNSNDILRLIWSDKGRAGALQALGEHAKALQSIEDALARATALTRLEPESIEFAQYELDLLILKAGSEERLGRNESRSTWGQAERALNNLARRSGTAALIQERRKMITQLKQEGKL